MNTNVTIDLYLCISLFIFQYTHVSIYVSLICFSEISREKADHYGKLKLLVFPMLDPPLTLILEPMLIYIMDGEFLFPQESHTKRSLG